MAMAIEKSESLIVETNLLKKARELRPFILDQQNTIERSRCLSDALIVKLKKSGVFRMTMPRSWGGLELDPIEQLRIIEELSYADASVGWCVMIGSDGGFYSGFIDQESAREMYQDIDSVTASALTATGNASETSEGFLLEGRWPFVSGCHYSDWFVLGCKVFKDGQQQFCENGTPQTLQCFVHAKDVEILDTWITTGLRGSGSHDVKVHQVLVPKKRTFSYQHLQCQRATALYCFPLNIILNFSSIPLGVAQRALDDFLSVGKRPSRITTINGELTEKRLLRDEAFIQNAVGKASAELTATRLYLYSVIEEVWDCLQKRQEMPPELFAQFQMVNAHVYQTCTEIVESLYKVRGGSVVYQGNALERCMRDLITMNQHVMNSLRSYSMGGRVLLGLPPEMILL